MFFRRIIGKIKSLFGSSYYRFEEIKVIRGEEELELSPEKKIEVKKHFDELSTSLDRSFRIVENICNAVFRKKQ